MCNQRAPVDSWVSVSDGCRNLRRRARGRLTRSPTRVGSAVGRAALPCPNQAKPVGWQRRHDQPVLFPCMETAVGARRCRAPTRAQLVGWQRRHDQPVLFPCMKTAVGARRCRAPTRRSLSAGITDRLSQLSCLEPVEDTKGARVRKVRRLSPTCNSDS